MDNIIELANKLGIEHGVIDVPKTPATMPYLRFRDFVLAFYAAAISGAPKEKDEEITRLNLALANKSVDSIELAKIHGTGFATATAHLAALRKQETEQLKEQLAATERKLAEQQANNTKFS